MTKKTPQYQQYLDARVINTISCRYPAEMQTEFVWLANYLRDGCSGNIDILMRQIANLGFKTTDGTIAKVIIGRWNRDSKNNVTAPIISIQNFLQIVDRLRKQARVSAMMGKVPFIPTSAWRNFEAYIDERRAEDAVCKMGVILGPTGSQKGACAKHYCVLHNHGTSSYFEAPFKPSVRLFRTSLAVAYGGNKMLRASDGEKHAYLCETINKTRVLYIANVQRLYMPGKGWYQDIFNWLHEMQEKTDCTVILEAVSDFQKDLQLGREAGFFEQFEGRCGGDFLILPQYPPAEDLYAIGAAFGLPEQKQVLKVLDEIVHQRGRIRRLFHVLQKAKRVASGQNEPLNLDHVREVWEDLPINVEPPVESAEVGRDVPSAPNRVSTIDLTTSTAARR